MSDYYEVMFSVNSWKWNTTDVDVEESNYKLNSNSDFEEYKKGEN